MKQLCIKQLVAILFLISSSQAIAGKSSGGGGASGNGPRSNLTLGVGNAAYKTDSDYTFDSLGGSLDVLQGFGGLAVGATYLTSEMKSLDEPDQKVVGGGLVIGYTAKFMDAFVGYGYGEAVRGSAGVGSTSDYITGPALLAGIRLNLLHLPTFTIGFAGSYMSVTDVEYKHNVSGTRSRVAGDVDSSLVVYGLNFNFAAGKP